VATNTDIYVSEYGERKPLYVDCQFNMASATSATFHGSASAGTVSATASILAANYTASCDGTVFSANHAVKIVFASGVFSGQADTYKCWIECNFVASRLISDTFKFVVSNDGD
jgi:hypothetical protein